MSSVLGLNSAKLHLAELREIAGDSSSLRHPSIPR